MLTDVRRHARGRGVRGRPRSLSDAALSAHVRSLDAERCRVEAAMTRAVAAADAREAWAYDGATSGTAWLALPVWAEPVVGGHAGAHGATIADDAQRPTTALARWRRCRWRRRRCWRRRPIAAIETIEVFARDEAVLVEHARRLTVDQTATDAAALAAAGRSRPRTRSARRRSAARVEHVRRSHGTQRLVDQR